MRSWLVYSLLALLMFGFWGVFSTAASKRLSPWQVQVFSTFGLVTVAAGAALAKDSMRSKNLRRGLFWAMFTGGAAAAANVALFAVLTRGADASIVFPLTGMYPLLTILIAWISLHERFGYWQKVGIVVALLAILLFSLVEGSSTSTDGVSGIKRWTWLGLSLICLLGWGISGVTQKLATRYISNGLSIMGFAGANLVVTAAIPFVIHLDWDVGWVEWALSLAVGVFFGLGALSLFAAYTAGGKVSVVNTLSSLYPAITVLVAIPLFGEQITSLRAAGIVSALAAGVLLSRESSVP